MRWCRRARGQSRWRGRRRGSNGFRLRSGTSETFVRRVEELGLPPAVATRWRPLCHVIDVVSEELGAADARLAAATKTDPGGSAADDPAGGSGPSRPRRSSRRSTTRPGFAGRDRWRAILASCRVNTARARNDVGAGSCGAPIRACKRCWCRRGGASGARGARRPSRYARWTRSIADRRGKKVAVVALARRLARILFGMWRDETDFAAERVGAGRVRQRAATPGPNTKVA